MKKKILLMAALLVASVMISSLGCRAKEEEKGEEKVPPKGKPAATKEKPKTKVVLTCGMQGHPQFEPGKEPEDGRCPQCGMKLVEKELPAEKAE